MLLVTKSFLYFCTIGTCSYCFVGFCYLLYYYYYWLWMSWMKLSLVCLVSSNFYFVFSCNTYCTHFIFISHLSFWWWWYHLLMLSNRTLLCHRTVETQSILCAQSTLLLWWLWLWANERTTSQLTCTNMTQTKNRWTDKYVGVVSLFHLNILPKTS